MQPDERHEEDGDTSATIAAPVSPHLALTHGLCAGRKALQFVDEEDEAAFVEKDFQEMRVTHLMICSIQLLVLPFSLTPLGVESRPVTWPALFCIVAQPPPPPVFYYGGENCTERVNLFHQPLLPLYFLHRKAFLQS